MLRGVSHSGSEYTCVHGQGVFEGNIDEAFVAGLRSWRNLNAVRLPLNEDCWLGINGVPTNSGGAKYQSEFKRVVDLFTSYHIVVLVDLHWTAPGSALARGQMALPDRDHAPTMWSQVARTFKDNRMVLFELFNEPFLGYSNVKDDDWICWANGTRCSGLAYQPAGQAEIIKAIRGTGASNVILMGGMTWSNDLSRWLEYAPVAADPLRQCGAVWHSYANNACNQVACWERTVKPVADVVPVVVTECGHGIDWASGLFSWIEKQAGSISYLPWTWNTWGTHLRVPSHAQGAGEALVSNYTAGTPTPWGQAVRAAFARAAPATNVATPQHGINYQ